jgi:structural maintenance of chromosomes protein 5
LEIRERVNNILAEHDDLVIRKAQLALDHKTMVSRIRSCHEELLDAEIRLIEAKSDIASLNDRNRDIKERVEREEELVRNVEADSRRVKDIAARALEVCKEINADPANAEYREQFAEIVAGTTVEALEMEIAAEESKLEFIHANNPNAIRDFEKRQVDLDKLKEKMAGTESRLGKLERYITKVRGQWEPELDKLIAEISDAFSYNFEQIGCAGEVSVHKDDDFEQWAIQIKVKFR